MDDTEFQGRVDAFIRQSLHSERMELRDLDPSTDPTPTEWGTMLLRVLDELLRRPVSPWDCQTEISGEIEDAK